MLLISPVSYTLVFFHCMFVLLPNTSRQLRLYILTFCGFFSLALVSACGSESGVSEHIGHLETGPDVFIESPAIISVDVHSAIAKQDPHLAAGLHVRGKASSIVISGNLPSAEAQDRVRKTALAVIDGRAGLIMDVIVLDLDLSRSSQAKSR